MAEHSARYRSNDPYDRQDSADPQRSQTPSNDPLAELARLIGQSDPFAAFDRGNRTPVEPAYQPEPVYQAESSYQHEPVAYDDASPPLAHEPGPQADRSDWQGIESARAAPSYDPYAQPVYQEPRAGDHHYDPHTYAGVPAVQADTPSYAAQPPAFGGAAPALHGQPPAFMRGDDHGAPPVEFYEDDEPSGRRKGLVTVAAVLCLAVIGTAGAYGYRTMFSGSKSSTPAPVIRASTEPTKVAPPAAAINDGSPSKLTYDRFGDRSQNERVVTREEQPLDMKDVVRANAPRAATAPGVTSQAPSTPPGNPPSVLTEPKRVRTVPIRPDQADTASRPPQAATAANPQRSAAVAPAANPPLDAVARAPAARPAQSANGPMSLSPDSTAPTRTAAIPQRPAAAATASPNGGFVVQVSSQRSEADAQSSYRSLKSKFSTVLGDRQSFVKRAELGDKGTYYRAMVGPFQSRDQAVQLCGSLKAAGGDCVVQTN